MSEDWERRVVVALRAVALEPPTFGLPIRQCLYCQAMLSGTLAAHEERCAWRQSNELLEEWQQKGGGGE